MGEYWKSKDHVEAVQDQKGKHGCKLCNEVTTSSSGAASCNLDGGNASYKYLHTFKQSNLIQRPYMTNTRFLMMFKVHNSCHNPSESPISRYRIGFEYFRRANPLACEGDQN